MQSAAVVRPQTLNGKLYQIVDFLKRSEQPQTFQQIFDALKIDLKAEQDFFQLLSANPKISILPNNTLAYKVFRFPNSS